MSDNNARGLLLTLVIPIGISGEEFLERAGAEGTLDDWRRAGLRWQFRRVEQTGGWALILSGPARSITRVAGEVAEHVDPCGCSSCRAERAGAEAEALLRSCGVPGWGRGVVEA